MRPLTSTLFASLLIWQLFTTSHSFGQESLQDELASLNAELDSIFANESDSLSLFSLIDEILKPAPKISDLQFRIGYSSRVTSAGRDFGVDQQGLSPGISFYHHSGLYTDLSGFWNSELDPKYNLSVWTVGYIGKIKSKTTYSFSYDHSFYTEKSDTQTLTNSVSGSVTQDFKYVYSGLDYSFSFGSETAHRIIWNLTGNIKTKGFGPFKRITFLPSVALLFGNQNITAQYTNTNHLNKFLYAQPYELRLFAHRLKESGFENATGGFLIRLQEDLNAGNDLNELQTTAYNALFAFESEIDQFSLMNYYLTLPILFETNRLNIYVSYNYNIPRNIEGSIYEYESNGYFGFAISYNIQIKNKRGR